MSSEQLGPYGPPPRGQLIFKEYDPPGPDGERWSLGWRIDRLGENDYGQYVRGEEDEQVSPLMQEVYSELFDSAVNFLYRHFEEHYGQRYHMVEGGE